ncbi:serine/threonine protein kinase [Xylophilus sp.]|uniref:serine/threonine protein kinase n=1 Tax=Xylophilus sp. TaxID=2653893 RepID=UPI0013B7D667|nr:serine/threonine protein kinase [Xylophilus sp.]KAF1050053.1 MAG: hypothetical protein GAK38_00078 [Xylophilus sp.]
MPSQKKSRPDPDLESTDLDFSDDDAGVNPLARPAVEIGREDDDGINDRLSAEQDVSSDFDDVSAHPFDDIPNDGALNFDDGTDMGHPRGDTRREGGTWEADGADSGGLGPPAEILSDHNGPSDPRVRRGG